MSRCSEGSEVPDRRCEPSVEPSVREPLVRSTPKRKVSAFREGEGAVEDVERLITEVKNQKSKKQKTKNKKGALLRECRFFKIDYE